jgi:hypothetical protein
VFLAYLSIIPGMAVFLVRIETDFVEYYDKFYDAVRSGGSLEYIDPCATRWSIPSSRAWARSPRSRPWPCWSPFVAGPGAAGRAGHLAPVPAAAASAGDGRGPAGGLMAVLNVFFYLDQRRTVLLLCVLFVLLNVVRSAPGPCPC